VLLHKFKALATSHLVVNFSKSYATVKRGGKKEVQSGARDVKREFLTFFTGSL